MRAYLGENATAEQVTAYRHYLGLDEPVPVQYLRLGPLLIVGLGGVGMMGLQFARALTDKAIFPAWSYTGFARTIAEVPKTDGLSDPLSRISVLDAEEIRVTCRQLNRLVLFSRTLASSSGAFALGLWRGGAIRPAGRPTTERVQ